MSVHDLIDRSIAAREEMSQLLQKEKRARWAPMLDVTETDTGFQVVAELPGIDEEDVTVEISRNHLTISGFKSGARLHPWERPFFRERSFGGFHRSILLPSEVDETDVRVSLERGVLTVRLLKVPQEHEGAGRPACPQ